MEKNKKQLKSVFGKWWLPIRKWFYSSWLVYETSVRFYEYAQAVYQYFIIQKYNIGETGIQVLAYSSSILTFIICSVFLTLPAGFILYKFFKDDNLSKTSFEEKLKIYF